MRGATCFSGIGAPEVAIPWVQWRWYAEVEAFPSAALAHHLPWAPNLGDVTAPDFIERAKAQGPIDLLVAGSPCQAFSVAGLRGSLDDARGNLTLRLVEIVHAIRPRYFLWENVPGVLSTRDNAFGCFLGGLVGADEPIAPAAGWTSAGVVAGPIGTAAWRVLDAQHFGLPQRRKRVFVVFCFGDGTDPAEILFEFGVMRRDFAPSRTAGQGVTHELAPGLTSSGRGVERAGESRGQDPVIAMSLNSKGGSGRMDGESETIAGTLKSNHGGDGFGSDPSETFIACPLTGDPYADRASEESLLVTHSLRGDGFDASEDGTGRGTPLIAVPILEAGARTGKSTDDPRAGIGIGEPGDPMFTLQSGKQHAIAFDTTQITSQTNRSNPQPGDPCHPLNTGDAPAITVNFRGRDSGTQAEMGGEVATALRGAGGSSSKSHALTGMAVRRLTPTECERLQGFPDEYTAILYRGKPAADGPRYRALGNSMAINVIAWIGERIGMVAEP